MKIRTWKSNDWNEYISNPGNGHAVPEYELNEKTKLIQIKLDKDGKQVFHDLFSDIQMFADTNSLERILKLSPDETIDGLDFRCATASEAAARSVDFTEIKSMAEIKDLQNRLASQGRTLDDLRNELAIKLATIQKQMKKQPEQNKNVEVKQDEKENKK